MTIDWSVYKVTYKGRQWSYFEIAEETGLNEETIKIKIRDYLKKKISVSEIFKPKPPSGLRLKSGVWVSVEDVVKKAKIDREIVVQRMWRVRNGKMSEEKLFKPKFNQGQGGKLSDFGGLADELSPERQAAWEAMKEEALTAPYLRQEQLIPTHDTPIFKGG